MFFIQHWFFTRILEIIALFHFFHLFWAVKWSFKRESSWFLCGTSVSYCFLTVMKTMCPCVFFSTSRQSCHWGDSGDQESWNERGNPIKRYRHLNVLLLQLGCLAKKYKLICLSSATKIFNFCPVAHCPSWFWFLSLLASSFIFAAGLLNYLL